MLKQISHFFFKTATGRIVLVVIVAMGAAYGARVALVDMPALQKKEAAQVGSETLEQMGDELDDALSADNTLAKKLPALTPWYPADLPCAAMGKFATPRDGVWDILGLPADGETDFQYRFQFQDGAFEIYARRDSDCDGLYAVWLLSGKVSGMLGREVTAQNILE